VDGSSIPSTPPRSNASSMKGCGSPGCQRAEVRSGSRPCEVPGFARHVRFTLRSRHRQPAPVCPFGANGLNRSRGRALRRAAWTCQQWMERWQRLT
jgi:hypothetical protein